MIDIRFTISVRQGRYFLRIRVTRKTRNQLTRWRVVKTVRTLDYNYLKGPMRRV